MTAPIPTGAPAPAAHGAPAAPPPAPAEATAAPVSPFEPAGVVFAPVSPRLITARLLGAEGANAVGAILGVALGVAVSPWLHLVAAAALVLAVWAAWLIPRQVRAMGYALAPDHLLWRKGIMFRSISVIPYGRMQFVDTSQGPLARALGIAEVKLHTAAATTDATINGLPVGEAERLRQILSERGEQRMAGL